MNSIRIAILVDGDWFSLILGDHMMPTVHWPTAETVYDRIIAAVRPDEFLLKIVYPNFIQKGVDMRIGIDIAILSIKRQVDRIVLFVGDTDLIPAMKLARREGIQVDLAHVARSIPARELIEHSDTLRSVPAS